MSPRRTRRGTVRVDTSVNESIKSSPKPVRRTRRINKSQHAKGSEEDDTPAEASSLMNNLTASGLLSDTTLSTRKRKKKGQDLSVTQNCSVSLFTDEINISIKKKNAKTPKASKTSKKTKTKKVDNSLLSEDESFNKKTQKQLVKNLMSEEENISATVEKKVRLSDHNVSKKNVNKTPVKSGPSTIINSSEGIVTPKSSPILNISLSPSRSTKTPRKSPINLGSPKTHSRYFLKALNVPRKLEIEESPPSSENSENLVQETSFKISKKKVSPLKTPTFSKSPKIVLKTPKAKSTKKSPLKRLSSGSKRPLKKVSQAKSIASPNVKSPKLNTTDKEIKGKKSLPMSPNKSAQSKQNTLTPNKTNVSFKLDQSSKIDTSLTGDTSKSQRHSFTIKSSGKKTPGSRTKNSSKVITPLSSSKMPKIVLAPKSRKSLTKSRTSTSNKSSPKTLQKSKTPLPNKSLMATPRPKKATPIKSPGSTAKSKVTSSKSPGSAAKSKKVTPGKSPGSAAKSKKVASVKSPGVLSKSKKPTPSKSPKFSPKLNSATKQQRSPAKFEPGNLSRDTSLSPRVMVSKLSTSPLSDSTLRGDRSGKPSPARSASSAIKLEQTQPSINLVPVDLGSQKPKSPRISIAADKASRSPKSSSKKQSLSSAVSIWMSSGIGPNGSVAKTPSRVLDKKLLHLKPTKTSTPRERTKRPVASPRDLNVSGTNDRTNKSKVIKKLNSQTLAEKSLGLLDDVSDACLDVSSLVRLSDVFEDDNSQLNSTFEVKKRSSSTPKTRRSPVKAHVVDEERKSSPSKREKSDKNDTYEVDEPKTPGFQVKSKKRTLRDAELDATEEQEAKKSCRVHFASPEKRAPTSINRIGTPGHAMQQKRTPISTSKTPVGFRKRGSSVSLSVKTPVATPLNKRRSQSLTDSSRKNVHQAQVASVNRLSKPKITVDSEKKSGLKTPLPKKIPNFAEIHQKNFDKMISIVDLKKRVENRHIALKTAPSSTKKNADGKPAPPDASSYSRFGFKMRKTDAVNLMSKKQPGSANTREKKREDARSTLKGVRMNRRFELQMKARIKTS